MDVLIFRALWGMTGPFEEQITRIADAGYDGIELWLDGAPPPETVLPLMQARGLRLVAAMAVGSADDLEPTLDQLMRYNPIKINLHSGRDSMTRDEGCAFYERSLALEAGLGVPVSHETHRGRCFFNPWDTAFYLSTFPALRLTADYSHWVNVCERTPDDQAEAMALANSRTIHIHGRVGYEEGPQVPDPSAPEYTRHREWHEVQWLQIAQHQRGANTEFLTFTPEYGPPNYLHTLPHTNVPVADLWEVCLWGMRRAREILV